MRDIVDNITYSMTKRNFFDAAEALVEAFKNGEYSQGRLEELDALWSRY